MEIPSNCSICFGDINNRENYCVLFHCECVFVMCKSCCLQQITSQLNTYSNGLTCPVCRQVSQNIRGITECQIEEERLVKRAFNRFGLRSSRRPNEIEALRNQMKSVNFAISGTITLDDLSEFENEGIIKRLSISMIRLELARYEHAREQCDAGDIISDITTLPLGPLSLLTFPRNILLEQALLIQNEAQLLGLSLTKENLNETGDKVNNPTHDSIAADSEPYQEQPKGLCICGEPENGLYIPCSDGTGGCNGWIHPKCIPELSILSAKDLRNLVYTCYLCDKAEPSLALREVQDRRRKLLCSCKGYGHGPMIQCSFTKKCVGAQWYHVACVARDTSTETSEIRWLCPYCTGAESPAQAAKIITEIYEIITKPPTASSISNNFNVFRDVIEALSFNRKRSTPDDSKGDENDKMKSKQPKSVQFHNDSTQESLGVQAEPSSSAYDLRVSKTTTKTTHYSKPRYRRRSSTACVCDTPWQGVYNDDLINVDDINRKEIIECSRRNNCLGSRWFHKTCISVSLSDDNQSMDESNMNETENNISTSSNKQSSKKPWTCMECLIHHYFPNIPTHSDHFIGYYAPNSQGSLLHLQKKFDIIKDDSNRSTSDSVRFYMSIPSNILRTSALATFASSASLAYQSSNSSLRNIRNLKSCSMNNSRTFYVEICLHERLTHGSFVVSFQEFGLEKLKFNRQCIHLNCTLSIPSGSEISNQSQLTISSLRNHVTSLMASYGESSIISYKVNDQSTLSVPISTRLTAREKVIDNTTNESSMHLNSVEKNFEENNEDVRNATVGSSGKHLYSMIIKNNNSIVEVADGQMNSVSWEMLFKEMVKRIPASYRLINKQKFHDKSSQ